MQPLDVSKCSTRLLRLNYLRNSSTNLSKIWIKSESVDDTFALAEVTIGPSNQKADIQVRDATAEGGKEEGGKAQVAGITLEEEVVLDVLIAVVEHQNKRKGICSISDWSRT